MKKAILVGGLFLAGCASQPDEIMTSYVSPIQYSNYDCQQLAMESSTINQRANQLKGSLKKKADDDAAQMGVGLILFWPTLFFLEGGDGAEAQEYARLKGEHEAIETASIQKKCGNETIVEVPGEQDVSGRLTKLKSLKEKGLITEEEYEERRVAILSDI